MKRWILFLLVATLVLGAAGAQAFYTSKAVSADEKAMAAEKRPDFSSPEIEDKAIKVAGLPEQVKWMTAKTQRWGSTRAKQGGTYHYYIAEFPTTFRTVGPNSNHAYREYIRGTPGLVEINSETKEILPALASHWAFAADGKTVYYKINDKAKWSDGKPVLATDYTFMYDLMRSDVIQDPWYKEYYTDQITAVKAFGDKVVAVTAYDKMAPADLLVNTSLNPRPAHFYGGKVPEEFIEAYNWKAEPTAGPYYLADFVKGESLTFQKVKNWWGHEYGYNQGRFNFDAIEYKVITGGNDILKNYFYKGELDQFYMIIPQLWADEAKNAEIQKGYIDREYVFYVPLQGVQGIFLNTKFPLFSDLNLRKGMYYAINIQKMIDTELRGEYARNHNIGIGHAFAGIEFNDNTIRKPDFDPAKAGELFAKAGYDKIGSDGIRVNAKGDKLAFELIYASPNHTNRIAVLKEEAKKAGVEINMNLMQKGSFTALREKNYQAYWGGMSTSLYPDYWEYFHSSNADKPQTNNFWGYADPEMDKVLDAYRNEGDLKKKAEYTKKTERMVHEAALVIPHYYVPYNRAATWKWVRFPKWLSTKYYDDFFEALNSGGYGDYFGFQWIDEDIRKEVLAAQKAGKAYESRTFIDTTNKAK